MKRPPITIPQGEDRKIEVLLTNLPDGVTMEDVLVTFSVSAGHHSKTYDRTALRTTADGKYYIPVATSDLGIGDLKLTAHVRVPDEDFADGYRDEYPEVDLNAVIVPKSA